jgi:hypothetical protein
MIKAPQDSVVVDLINHCFTRLWENRNGQFTLPLSKYQNKWVYLECGVYRLQEILQLTTY